MITAMSDILADYREWKAQQEERIGTHSDRCHMWPRHERCMIHRLAAEVESLRELADKRGSIAVKRRREIERLRTAIRRLAEQDATLSVQGGNVTVTMDAMLTDEEREAIERAIDSLVGVEDLSPDASQQDDAAACVLRSLLERIGGGACGE